MYVGYEWTHCYVLCLLVHWLASAHRGRKALHLPEVDLLVIVSHLMWMLGTRSSAEAVLVLNHWAHPSASKSSIVTIKTYTYLKALGIGLEKLRLPTCRLLWTAHQIMWLYSIQNGLSYWELFKTSKIIDCRKSNVGLRICP